MRCFAAILLPREVIELAGKLRRAIALSDQPWRKEKWVAEENLHVTLAFFGEMEEESVTSIIDALRVTPVSPFELTSPGFSPIPNARRASMAWLSFADETGKGGALASWARSAGIDAGVIGATATFEDPPRPFKPHVTLVRARMPRTLSAGAREAAADVLARASGVSMSVLSVSVFSSTLTPSGPRYQLLETVPLRHP